MALSVVAELKVAMAKVAEEQAKAGKLTRRFVVIDALSELIGDRAGLPKPIELKEKYKFRLLLDDRLV